MIFLIEYDRRKGHLVMLRRFKDSEWTSATALENTHRRYFRTASQIVEAGIKALS